MANISKVYLLSTPLEDDMKNTLYFANASAQQTYMNSCIVKSYTNVSYQREQMVFRCPAQIDTIRNCNYLMFQNTAYSNKWFYGFIKKMTYIDNGRTDIEFEIDPLQTFMFDITIKPSFIEREHTNDDSIGSNTIPEQLELGDYVEGNLDPVKAFSYGASQVAFAMGCTKIIDLFTSNGHTPIHLGLIPDGLQYLGFEDLTYLKTAIKAFNDAGHGDYINCIFICPKSCFSNYIHLYGNYRIDYSMTFTPGYQSTVSLTTDNLLAGGYNPRNKKLLTFPYRYLQMSNLNGSVANYHYEYFKNPLDGTIDTTPSINLTGYATPGCDAKVYPSNYKGITYNYDEGISYSKLPVGSWNTDVFTNWLTQNGVNIATGFISDIASIGVGLATAPAGGGVGIASGITGITNKVGQIYEHSMQPPQAEGATNVGSASYNGGMSCISFKHMSIKPEFARVADDYMDMFGYATHRVKAPNVAHRQNWWYTKTIDVAITGDVPNEYMNQIKGCYNAGITFWRNPSNFLNYSVSNGIV